MSDTLAVEVENKVSLAERLGMHPGLAIGYLGLLLFMIGDGVEAGFLSPLLVDLHFSTEQVALVFSAYGATAALASWLSGALTDIFGPKKVMWAGLLIWISLEIPFLLGGIAHANYTTILVSYGIRGFGYPLFAYGFLCWVAAVTPERYLGTAIGWFWSARTGGLPTLGALMASFSVPMMGSYKTLWASVVLVAAGGLIALLGVREKHGNLPLSTTGDNPLKVLLTGVSIIWKHPKVGLGGIVATITTTSEFGFLVFLPIFFIQTVGFTLTQWLQILSVMFATNVVANLFWGWVGDKVGWRRTITFAGACGCALTTLGLFYVPHIFGANYALVMMAGMAYGVALAGFVPIAAIMSILAPESRGAAMSVMNLGSGLSAFLGPALAGIFLPLMGVSGVIWIFAIMYLVSAVVSYQLKLPGVHPLR
ncbi:MAG: MFS transporter [Terracidiphilus sp.]|nr:MFS transporter [Terracidiphilus sp.]MDR3777333.1 MFS transporter [Terracidiphilus sp.]